MQLFIASKRIRKLLYAVYLLLISLVVGTTGFMLIEDYGLLDAFYMTVITISTVGFTEVQEMSDTGRIFTAFYILFNLSIFAYIISVITQYIFEGELREIYKTYLSNIGVKKMKDHIIICGYGRNGSRAAQELAKAGYEFVVIDGNDDVVKMKLAAQEKIKYIEGDATNETILEQAGIERAETIIATLPKDADNLYVTLAAKQINPSIKVISRASEENSESKLKFAGADYVIMPDLIGGTHMANLVIRPSVTEFLEAINGVGEDPLMLEEVKFEELRSEFQSRSISDLEVRQKTGVTVIGLKNKGEELKINPDASEALENGSTLVILGTSQEIKRFHDVCM